MRVLIVDDHEVVRKGVSSLLRRSGYDVCGEGVDGEDAIEKAKDLRPDIIVMDVSMPKLNGLEATRRILNVLPHSEVLILSQHESPEMVRQAVSSGARGYVVKSSIARDLLAAIVKVSRHETFFDPAVTGSARLPAVVDVQETVQRSVALELALRENEELYRATFEQAAVGMCHVSLDGHFLRVNSKICNFLGYSKDELLKLTYMDITHLEDVVLDMQSANVLLAGTQESYQIEKRYLRKDGTVVWGQLTVSLLRDQHGNPRHFISVVADIDDRKGLEEAMRSSEDQFRNLANFIPQLTWIADKNGSIFWYNQRWYDYTGTTLEQVEGWGWESVHHPEHIKRVVERVSRAWKTGEPWEDTFPLRGKDGRYRMFLSRALPLKDGQAQVVKWFGTNTDIGEYVEAQKP